MTPEGFEMAIMLLSVEEETRQRTFFENPSEKTKISKDKFEKEKTNIIEKTANLPEENKNEKKGGIGSGVSDQNILPLTGQEKFDAYLSCEKVRDISFIYK